MLILDFDRARLSWKTHPGVYGSWRLVASARPDAAEQNSSENFFLAPAVMAGQIFGSERLPMDPPYSYQVFASSERHTILREPADGSKSRHNSDLNEKTFSALEIHAPQIDADLIEIRSLREDSLSNLWPISVRLAARVGPQNDRWILEFPANHISVQNSNFQIETGPVLLPARIKGYPAGKPGGFVTAYLFFNRLDRADALIRDSSNNGQRAFNYYARLEDVQIELYCRKCT